LFFSYTKRIWLSYAAILALLIGVLAWFSWFTVCLDQQAAENRRTAVRTEQLAAQQERISRALWRMDWSLSPLVAQEAARTYWMYESSIRGMPQQPSPLLSQPEFVALHFQLDPNDALTSPQAPPEPTREIALANGVAEAQLAANSTRLSELSGKLKFQPLWQACSDIALKNTLNAESDSQENLQAPNQIAQNQTLSSISLNTPSLEGSRNQSQQQDVYVDQGAIAKDAEAQSQSEVAVPQQSNTSKAQAADFVQRGRSINQLAYGQRLANEVITNREVPVRDQVVEGVLRPIWMDGQLMLIRRVEAAFGVQLVQGCILDWPAIKNSLLQEIADIVPDAELVPRLKDTSEQFGSSLATLPIDLVAPAIKDSSELVGNSGPGLLSALIVAWGGLLIGAMSTGWLIFGITKLSERRAAFASAVTHELRTPLTTFRLYSEMLASNMVTDESQRANYASGLVREADRLCRLVENVLQFARLEQKRAPLQSSSVTVEALLHEAMQRCRDRAESAGMTLELSIPDSLMGETIRTSKDIVDQILFNLVDNACKYANESKPAEIRVEVAEDSKWLVISVRDYGPGIDAKLLKRLFQPFARSSDETAGTAAGVGLGLSLSRQLAKRLGGRLDYRQANPGSVFELRVMREA
jgi:signal transduction histidine kinase